MLAALNVLPPDLQAAMGANETADEPKSKRARQNSENAGAVAESKNESFTAEAFIKGLGGGEEKHQLPSESTEIVITNRDDGEQYAQDVKCLLCGKEIE